MRIYIKDRDINTGAIMRARGLGDSTKAQKFMASEIARRCDKRVPMQQGILKNTKVIAEDGSSITYVQPYAHYHYVGELMIGRAPKRYTGIQMDYHGGPMRGPQWDKRMMADEKPQVLAAVAKYVGGHPG